MNFAQIRRTLFVVHMWVGLGLGVLLAVLGISGSILVYDDAIADLLAPPPRAEAQGSSLPLDAMIAAARTVSGNAMATPEKLTIMKTTNVHMPAMACSSR